jgi:CHAD domain-containing protein
MSSRSLLSAVSAGSKVVAGRRTAIRRVYLDTADWRAHSRGWTVEADWPAAGTAPVTLTIREGETELVVASTTRDWTPRYATDLPKASPWSELGDTIEGRRLLEQAAADVSTQSFSVVNADGKTTARMEIQRSTLAGPDGHRRVVRTASVTPLRGYERAAERVCAALEGAGLTAGERTMLAVSLDAVGRPGPGPAPGPGVHLDRGLPSTRAMALVLGRLREHLVANQQGVAERLDTEFLHEFRVAVRRARSMVKQARSCLPVEQARHFASELAWLGAVTSPVRDLDVHLEELGGAAEDDLRPLRDFLAARRDDAQGGLVGALASARYAALVEEWRLMSSPATLLAATSATAVASGSPPDARKPIGEVADRYLWRAYRRVVRDGSAIGPTSPPEALHELRKRAKELRYLLECFQTLYPEDELRAAVKELKAFQDNLGEYQDCQVQAAALRTMAEEIMDSRSAPAATLMAMGRLAEEQERREARSRAEFAGRFGKFSSKANRRRFASLVSRPEDDGAEGSSRGTELEFRGTELEFRGTELEFRRTELEFRGTELEFRRTELAPAGGSPEA